jgi:predicted transcriptional regulator of viral defense system
MSRVEHLAEDLTNGTRLYRTSELRKQGISSRDIKALLEIGVMERLQRGLYLVGADQAYSEFSDFAEVSKMVSKGVICLYSALAYYDLTTFVPPDVYVALPPGAWRARLEYPPVQYFTFSGIMYELGLETVTINNTPVRIYDREKTICDCFRFRNRLGLDSALEGLKFYMRSPHANINKLMDYARQCRVRTILTPYLEVLLA